ncbi:hypothetical protein B0T25DRAFT_454485 [Lasiosphaeria hispida]|uniref:F-box domain-containing protein n=1 Tax=Lasiosphaeria hispida TaxID=260671 RepID=A0AAJ0ME60_9PEZI|nr:hypothetical protein B0T25DRAFT_454485 [Lasiosphaeria hispida]
MASTLADEAPSGPSLSLAELPREVQKEIFSHCSQGDLICLSLVSKHFRELAAAQLYRNFHIVFPDEDDPSFDCPIDGLAGGLDTFVTSDYDYAKHLRDLSLDTLSAGDKAESAYKPYLYNVSCGKFMNTLLLLTLRKAKALESFRWNIRVELSRPVYQALHQIDSLAHVHIRLQAGPSLYEAPPPLPYNSSQPIASSSSVTLAHLPGLAPPPTQQPALAILNPPSVFYVPTSSAPPPSLPKPVARAKAPKKSPLSNEPSTLSGFKKLKTLAVLDMDTLDLVNEIKTCVKNSAGTLQKLKLSFSEHLAWQARKPPPDMDPEDSDPDDEFQVVPIPPPGPHWNDDVSGPAKAFRAQEERKNQESVLGRIFEVEPSTVKKAPKKPREKEKEVKEEPSANPGRDFINAIKVVSAKLMKDLNGAGDFTASQQEILSAIEYAARKYVASEEAKSRDEKQKEKTSESSSDASTTQPKPEPTVTTEAASSSSDPSVSLFSESTPTKVKDANQDADPEDINIEEPEEQLVIEPQDAPANEISTPIPSVEPPASSAPPLSDDTPVPAIPGPATTPDAQHVHLQTLVEKLAIHESRNDALCRELQQLGASDDARAYDRILETATKAQAIGQGIRDHHQAMVAIKAEIADVKKQISSPDANTQMSSPDANADSQSQSMSDYLRSTRGLALQSFSVYLIPVKASVLTRALDLRVLRRITLLNVGSQAPIWLQLQKENKESPLPLRKIFTDNVSGTFLTFVNQLEELHEFFILERDSKYKPESFAPKTTTTIDQIRRLVLKKHMPTLRRLMIKNQSDTSWDISEKAVLLICRRGKQLQELACSMGIKVIHTFMQHLAGLISLRALHIIQLRNDDTCVWVMRETKRFLIDNLSHHPHLKLEWISVDDDDRVERLIRPSEFPRKEKRTKKSKGKQKAGALGGGSDLFPVLPPLESWDVSSDSDDDEDLPDSKIETVDNIHFYDVWGVRIFKKEVVHGWL